MMRLNTSANLIGPCREHLRLVADLFVVAINSLFVPHITFLFFLANPQDCLRVRWMCIITT